MNDVWVAIDQPPSPGPSLRTMKKNGHQLAVVTTEDGRVYALDNRCPHEGYPLAQGELKGCTLTCAWHNWKFDVSDGSCVLGGEAVRSYPVRTRDGRLEVDLSEPDPDVVRPRLQSSLREGLFRHEPGRAIRDGVRLLQGGYRPEQLLADLAAYDARHAEYGSTHVLPVAADSIRLLERHPGLQAMQVIAPVIDQCGEANRRLPERVRPNARPGATEAGLRQAVEAEDLPRAEGLLRGAIEAGTDRETIEGWLYGVLSDHFTDFGHQLIYLVKSQELLDASGDDRLEDIYSGLLYGILVATREDTLPYWKVYREHQARLEPELPTLFEHQEPATPFDPDPVSRAVLDGTAEEAMDGVARALRAGVDAPRIAEALVEAAARRMLRFDLSLEANPDIAENWLWASHRFTFASAVRNAVTRYHHPDSLRFMFQAVAFIHSGRPMDRTEEAADGRDAATASDVVDAIAHHEVSLAVARARACLRAGGRDELQVSLEDCYLEAPLVRPIFLAHALKTTVAAFEEFDALGGGTRGEPAILAAVRFLASPLRENRLPQTVRTAVRWVAEGITPRKLTQ